MHPLRIDIGIPLVLTDEILGGAFLWLTKDRSTRHNQMQGKRGASLHIEENWTYRRITKDLEIHDADHVKKWIRKFREQGEFGYWMDESGESNM